ncbi:MAG: hypothetical protein AAF620_15250 [Bacteroidota bacterium]
MKKNINLTIEQLRKEYVPYEKTVNINRAPTDESVALLNEFEEKALRNIVYKTKIEQNHLRAIAIYLQNQFVHDRIDFIVKFELNGKQFVVRDFVDNFEWRGELSSAYGGFGHKDIFSIVHKKLSEMIAEELMLQSPDFLKNLTHAESKIP